MAQVNQRSLSGRGPFGPGQSGSRKTAKNAPKELAIILDLDWQVSQGSKGVGGGSKGIIVRNVFPIVGLELDKTLLHTRGVH